MAYQLSYFILVPYKSILDIRNYYFLPELWTFKKNLEQ